MNLPNKLTVLRVIMIPFFVVFMLTDLGGQYSNYIALVIFCGKVLRICWMERSQEKYNSVTNFESLWIRLRTSFLWERL